MRMRHKDKNHKGISFGRYKLIPDAEGVLEVPTSHIDIAKAHGFEEITDEPAPAPKETDRDKEKPFEQVHAEVKKAAGSPSSGSGPSGTPSSGTASGTPQKG